MTRSPNLVGALDYLRFDSLTKYAELSLSYWISVREAALCSEQRTIEVHCRQIAAVTREAFAVAKMLGAISDKAAA